MMFRYGFVHMTLRARRTPERNPDDASVRRQRSVVDAPVESGGDTRRRPRSLVNALIVGPSSAFSYPDDIYPEDVGLPLDFACMIWLE